MKYSNSEAEPRAIDKNRLNSESLSLPQPSLILLGIETAALLI